MKTIAPLAMAAIAAGTAIVAGAVEIRPRNGGDVIRVWNGPCTLTPPSIGEAFQGIGGRGIGQQTAGQVGGGAQGLNLTLSGIDPAVLELVDPDEIKSASIVIYRLIFASDGKTLLDAHVFDRGRGDAITVDETIGGTAAITIAVESAARGLGRSGARQRSDADQRLFDHTDGYFKNTGYAPEKMLYWGGKKPSRAIGSLRGAGA
jgi:hypothetical protein